MGGLLSFLFGWEDAQTSSDHARRDGYSTAKSVRTPVKHQGNATVVRKRNRPKKIAAPTASTHAQESTTAQKYPAKSDSRPATKIIVLSTNTENKDSSQKLAVAVSQVDESIKYYAKYVCPTCEREWDSEWEGAELIERCEICLARALPTRHKLAERCFGEYRCPKCHRYWSSTWSWTGYRQKCFKCRHFTFAFSRRPLLQSDDDDNNGKVHRSDLCEKCLKLGRKCTIGYYDDYRYDESTESSE